MIRWPGRRTGWWAEPALALAVLAGGIYSIGCLLVNGYLPQPFFYQAFDVWMDWFNTAFWSHNPGAYDSWRTLYPPVSFIFLKFLTLPYCYVANEGWPSRDCDWYGALTMHGLYVLNVFLIAKTFLKIDRSTALPRSFVLAAGMPMLDGLERGNLIMLCFTFFLLGHGPLLRSARLRWLAAGLAVNFKIYLVSSLAAYLLRRRWRWFEGAFLATIGVYLLTWGWLGSGTPREIYDNLSSWSDITQQVTGWLDLWYATTYVPVISMLTSNAFPILDVIGSGRTETFAVVLPAAVHATQLIIVLAAAATWLRPEVVPTYRIVNLCTCLALITSEAGGYVQALMIFLTFFERWRGPGSIWAIVTCYVLSIPGDIYIDPVYPSIHGGFLNTGPVFYAYWITMGPFLRPALVLSVPIALACVVFHDVWADVRAQGWKQRWRYRNDLALLPAGGYVAPAEAAPIREAA